MVDRRKEKKATATKGQIDSRQRGERGERESGQSQTYVPPAGRAPLGCGRKVPLRPRRTRRIRTVPRPGAFSRSRPQSRSVRERTAASQALSTRGSQASGPSHLLARGWGLRRAAVRTARSGARSGFPEVSEHALGWLAGGVRVGGWILTHSSRSLFFL